MLLRVFLNARQILVRDGQVVVDLGDQRRVKLAIPAIDADPQEQRQNNEHWQQCDRQKTMSN
jgi:hypothetical protein